MKKQPNILLVMTDEMRGDCIGAAGHPDVKTPYLDTLLSNGIYYPNAYSACPSCVPARAALHTGLSQSGHGRVGYQDGVDWNYPVTMAGELTRAGYYTQCVGKMHVHPLRNRMGFHNVELHDGYLNYYRRAQTPYWEDQRIADDYFYWLKDQAGMGCDVTNTGLECNSWVARPWIYNEEVHPTNWVASRSIDFLRRRDRQMPFFLMASFVRPHAPYDAPRWYFDLYRDRELRAPVKGDWNQMDLGVAGWTYNSDTGPSDPQLIREQQVGYYASITHVDHQIGRIIQELGSQGEAQNTVILFTSDHGEMLSDHGMVRKSRPYQGSIRIPMILYGPKAYTGGSSLVCEDLVELRDVMPTLLAMAGAGKLSGVEGESFLPGSRKEEREYLHGEHFYGEKSMHYIVTKTDKYIWYSQTGKEQYFSLTQDPQEQKDLGEDPAAANRKGYLRGCLIKELRGREEGYSDGKRLIAGRPPQRILKTVLSEGEE